MPILGLFKKDDKSETNRMVKLNEDLKNRNIKLLEEMNLLEERKILISENRRIQDENTYLEEEIRRLKEEIRELVNPRIKLNIKTEVD